MCNMSFCDLKKLLAKETLARCVADDAYQNLFKEIAGILLNKTAILKGDKKYYIKDVEFYLYNDCHRDIITYPRKCEAGQWYFHSSGVDISFESNVNIVSNEYGLFQPVLDSDSFFGGILIRQIYPESALPEDAKNYRLDGPYKVEWELFDQFDAFNEVKDFPYLVPREDGNNKINTSVRQNLLPSGKTVEQKVKGILNNNFYDSKISENELVVSFSRYKDAKYRFSV